jgi:hypothetical protein
VDIDTPLFLTSLDKDLSLDARQSEKYLAAAGQN